MGGSAKDPRKVFEKSFLEIGKENDRVLAVSCDSAKGGGLWSFVQAFPERYVEVGISEQNAIGICAGLASAGYIPVVVAITPFITMRCYEQIRDDIGYVNMNVKIVGSGGGLAYSTLGSTHEAVEDIAVMRTIPNMMILTPGDAYEVEAALKEAVKHVGPVYIRMPRQAREDIADSSKRNFKLGKAEILEAGDDIALLACGTMVKEALRAAAILKEKGINAAVADFPTVKPLDTETIISLHKKCKMLVTLEEHSVVNGFGSAVADAVSSIKSAVPLYIMGVKEGSKNTGPYRELLEEYSLTGSKIAEKIIKLYEE